MYWWLRTSFSNGVKIRTTLTDTEKWKLKFGFSYIISICVPKSALKHYSVFYFSWLDIICPAYYFSDISYFKLLYF